MDPLHQLEVEVGFEVEDHRLSQTQFEVLVPVFSQEASCSNKLRFATTLEIKCRQK